MDDQWKLDNEAQFANITADPSYTKLNALSNNGHIMYKVIEEATGDRSPYFNEYVKVRYTGWFKYNWNLADEYVDDNGNYITNKIIFDTTEEGNIPRTFRVDGLVEGFSTALQFMKEGDKWEVWMPSKLAYGENSQGDIRPNTTLAFKIELVEIVGMKP